MEVIKSDTGTTRASIEHYCIVLNIEYVMSKKEECEPHSSIDVISFPCSFRNAPFFSVRRVHCMVLSKDAMLPLAICINIIVYFKPFAPMNVLAHFNVRTAKVHPGNSCSVAQPQLLKSSYHAFSTWFCICVCKNDNSIYAKQERLPMNILSQL